MRTCQNASLRYSCCLAAFVLASLFGLASATAQIPEVRLTAITPAAGQPGQEIDVVIQGTDLDDVNQLQFTHAGITAKPKMREPGAFETEPQVVPNEFVVTVAGDVPAGHHDVRVVGKYGISNPRVFVIDALVTIVEVEGNNQANEAQALELPTAVFGQLAQAADVDYFTGQATAGQRIIVRCQARSIDSRMIPVVVVVNSEGRVLGNSRSTRENEPLVDFITPADGSFMIKVYDSAYRNGPEYFYRLAVGNLPHIDYVFPPAGEAGGDRPFTLFGRNLPGGQPAGVMIDGVELQKLAVTIPLPAGEQRFAVPRHVAVDSVSGGIDQASFQLQGATGSSNAILVGITDTQPLLEVEPNSQPTEAQQLTLPVDLAGRFEGRADYDWYTFEATQGDELIVEVICERHHRISDARLVIQQIIPAAEGEEEDQIKLIAAVQEGTTPLAGLFDARTSDPVYRFDVPADGTYRVLVNDALNMLREDPRQAYRLVIRPRTPDFRVVAVPERGYSGVLLRKGGQLPIQLVAFRRNGFNEEIRVTAANLPAGVTAAEVTIGPGMTSTLMELRCAADAAPATGQFTLITESTVNGESVSRPGRFATINWAGNPQQGNNVGNTPVSRLTSALAIAISSLENEIIGLELGDGSVVEAPRAQNVKFTYKRRGEFKGKLTLNASGQPPNAAVKQLVINANAETGEFVVELKANTPPGTYTMYLRGTAEKVKYSRNPEAVVVAQEKKTKVDQIKADADAAAKVETDAKTVADKAAVDAVAVVKAADVKKVAADKVLATAETAAKAATDAAVKAKAAAAAKPEDEGLKTAAANAQKAAEDAAAKLKTAQAAVVTAQKELDDAKVVATKADEAKLVQDKKTEDATALAKAAAELKTATDKLVTDTTNAAKPKEFNLPFVSSPFTIKVTPAPITLVASPADLKVKQGEMLAVPVQIARLYGYADEVTVAAVIPGGVAGLSIPNVAIANGQVQAPLAITAAANATVGTHQLTVRVTLKLNNQNLTVEQPLQLIVEEVKKTE